MILRIDARISSMLGWPFFSVMFMTPTPYTPRRPRLRPDGYKRSTRGRLIPPLSPPRNSWKYGPTSLSDKADNQLIAS